MPETLNGLIERVTYHNPENGFAVLKVKIRGRQDLVTVVGSTTSVSAGEHLEATGRCLHHYVYFIDKELGLCYLRIPTWAPFRLQFYFNGHNWLARQLEKKGIGYQQVDNAFVHLDDFKKAQKLADRMPNVASNGADAMPATHFCRVATDGPWSQPKEPPRLQRPVGSPLAAPGAKSGGGTPSLRLAWPSPPSDVIRHRLLFFFARSTSSANVPPPSISPTSSAMSCQAPISAFTAGDSADALGSLTAEVEPPITSITWPSDSSAGGQTRRYPPAEPRVLVTKPDALLLSPSRRERVWSRTLCFAPDLLVIARGTLVVSAGKGRS